MHGLETSTRFGRPVDDTDVSQVDKRAAIFCPNKHKTKMQWTTNVFDNGSCLSFSLLYLFTFLPFHRLHV